MKKILLIVFSIFFILMTTLVPLNTCVSYAETENEISQTVNDQIENIDFSDVEKIVESLDENTKSVFEGKSFLEKIFLIITGEGITNFSSITELVLGLLFDNILSFLPLVAIIIAISILSGMLSNLNSSSKNKSMTNIVHFIVYSLIVIMLSSIIIKMVSLTNSTLLSIQNQINVIFPILLTTLTALGGTASVSAYQPAVAIFSNFIIQIFSSFILPLFLVSLVLNLVSNLSNSVKLDKLISFVNSLSKWVIGIVFTIFSGFIAIQGISAGAIDGLSIKTAKFTIKNSVPIVGSYLSDGMFLILASTNLIKNAVGGAGLLLLLASVISPIIELVLFMLALKLMGGLIEPLGESKVANFVCDLSKSMSMLIVIIASVSFMYMLLTGLVMCSANVF